MITKNTLPDWQQALANAITDPTELVNALDLEPSLIQELQPASQPFKLKVTHSYLSRMHKKDPHDPLLLQVLPLRTETKPQPVGYSADPVGDGLASPIPGLIHKYHGRVLIIMTGACPIHCRFCFRRHFPYCNAKSPLGPALEYVASDTSIDEVILSGGDPLMLSDKKLAKIIHNIATIPHVKRLRIHTRTSITLPERITDTFIQCITQPRLEVLIVVHCNHPQELSKEVADRHTMLSDAGIRLFNQTVLLRGVNNHLNTLETLFRKLFSIHIQPYYLHLLDQVSGAAHFEVEHQTAVDLYAKLGTRLPGYMLPRLVREDSGQASKTIISTN
jgi:EF-P beta-lysylation protein EpmB